MTQVTERFESIPLDQIFCDHDFNSRSYITPASVGTLAADIEANGLQQPIVLQPYSNPAVPNCKWRIIMGHRRFLATQTVCKRRPDFPKTIMARLSESMSEEHALVLNLKENMEREQLNIVQEARAISRFEAMGWDAARIAKELGQPKQWVTVRLALLTLPEQIQKRAEAGWLTQYDVEALSEMASDEERFARVREIVDHKLRGEKKSRALVSGRVITRVSKVVLGKGEPRPMKVLLKMLDWIQDGMQDNKHPAAMAISFAVGILDEEQFRIMVEGWAEEAGLEMPELDITAADRKYA